MLHLFHPEEFPGEDSQTDDHYPRTRLYHRSQCCFAQEPQVLRGNIKDRQTQFRG